MGLPEKCLIYLVPRAEVPWDSYFNGLHCQTGLKVGTDAKQLFGALSNRRAPLTVSRSRRTALSNRGIGPRNETVDREWSIKPG